MTRAITHYCAQLLLFFKAGGRIGRAPDLQVAFFHVICLTVILFISSFGAQASILVLTPEDEDFIRIDDFFACFSLAGTTDEVRRVKVFFDHEDVSQQVRFTGTTVAFVPDRAFLNRPDLPGPHMLTLVLYGPYRARLEERSVRFYLVEDTDIPDNERAGLVEKGKQLVAVDIVEFVNSGKIYTGAEYASYRDSGNFMAELDGYANGYRGNWFYNTYVYLNSEEDRRYQTLQRFMLSTGYTKNYTVGFGDLWPSYNELLLADQRVRGIEVCVRSPKQAARLNFTYGRAKRAVAPYIYNRQALDEEIASWDTTANGPFGHNDSITFFDDGTYKRRLLATRLQFGTGRIISVGLDFLKAKEDTASIDQIYSIDDSGRVSIQGRTPKDNIAAGLDLEVNLWKRRITLFADYGFSFITKNIIGGPLTNQQITDAVGSDVSLPIKPQDIAGLLIVNSSTVPLPIPASDSEAVNSRSLGNAMAIDAGLRLNIPIGSVKERAELKFFRFGPNYASLGNENLQTDRAGFLLTEEVRFFGGKALVKGDLEYWRDDLGGMKSRPVRSVQGALSGTLFWDSRFPLTTLRLGISDQAARSTDSVSSAAHNRFNTANLCLQYARHIGYADNTFSLTYGNSYSLISSTALAGDIALRINSFSLSSHTRFDDSPWESRASATANLSRGEYGVNLLSALLGVTRHIIPDAMYVDIDAGYDYAHNDSQSKEHELIAKSSLNYDISDNHSVFAAVGIAKTFGTGSVNPNARASYEFRF